MIAILCLEDEADVRNAILRDLRPFESHFRIEAASDAADADAVLGDLKKDGDALGLILCDHRLPGESGVDFLTKINACEEWRPARKVLLTGQAGHADTIRAINQAGLNHYIAKPWDPQGLVRVVREQLTQFVIENHLDPLAYLAILDPTPLLESLRQSGQT